MKHALILWLVGTALSAPQNDFTFQIIPQEVSGFDQLPCPITSMTSSSDGTLYVGTRCGLEVSLDHGKTFQHRTIRNGLKLQCVERLKVKWREITLQDCAGGTYTAYEPGETFYESQSGRKPLELNTSIELEDGMVLYAQSGQFCLADEVGISPYCFEVPGIKGGQLARGDRGEILVGTETKIVSFKLEDLKAQRVVAEPLFKGKIERAQTEADGAILVAIEGEANAFRVLSGLKNVVRTNFPAGQVSAQSATHTPGGAQVAIEKKRVFLLNPGKINIDLTPGLLGGENTQIITAGKNAWEQEITVVSPIGLSLFTDLPF